MRKQSIRDRVSLSQICVARLMLAELSVTAAMKAEAAP
jgi:hypothetical protein